jgi:hypothetical protein
MLLTDIDNRIRLLTKTHDQVAEELQESFDCDLHSPNYHFSDQSYYATQIKTWQRARKLLISYQELRRDIDALASDVDREEILELVDDIWYDVEATCPWSHPGRFKITRLANNISKAGEYSVLAGSNLLKTIKQDHILVGWSSYSQTYTRTCGFQTI